MNYNKIAVLGTVTIMTLGLASPSFAIEVVPEEPCDCPDPEPKKGNNGLGNGDQTAPGNSLTHNKAENQVGNPGHPSEKAQNSN